MIRKRHCLLLALVCIIAGCATMRAPMHEKKGSARDSIVAVETEKEPAVVQVATKLDPKLTFQLLPIRYVQEATDEKPELVSIDSFVASDLSESRHDALESLDQFELEFPGSRKRETGKAGVWSRVLGDQAHFYSGESLIELGLVFGAGALIANTDADNQLQKHFQSSVRGASSDEWFQFLHANKELGNGLYSLPIFGTAWLAGELIDGPESFESVGLWGERTTRGFLVGVPPMLLMQNITGGSRPYETSEGSEWHSFRDNNGVSGHAFMSSLPFITAAKMTDNPWQKTLWYTASTIGPLSRMNDNAHYPSQIGMGWAMAFVAASAVQQTDTGRRGWKLAPLSSLTSSGLALQYQW